MVENEKSEFTRLKTHYMVVCDRLVQVYQGLVMYRKIKQVYFWEALSESECRKMEYSDVMKV